MAYECRVICDSVNPEGVRLTTWLATYPRIILAEVNTHKRLSRNTASSRAIPVEKMIQRVLDDPFLPVYWGKNQKGMQAAEELDEETKLVAETEWLQAMRNAVDRARSLVSLGVHKQIANRLLEPFSWTTSVISATHTANFFNLRTHKAAQPEFRVLAGMMRETFKASTPTLLKWGDWHLPLVTGYDDPAGFIKYSKDVDEEPHEHIAAHISAGRCARTSYLTHEGKRDFEADLGLCNRLREDGHVSPAEHPAQAIPSYGREEPHLNYAPSNYHPSWIQLRKMWPNEAVFPGEATGL